MMVQPPNTLLDDLDYQIIGQLHKNAREEASKIARSVGANERTVRKRIDRLIEGGVIRPALMVSPRAFGYVSAVHLLLGVDPDRQNEVRERLLAMPEVSFMANGLGEAHLAETMIIVQARFEETDEIREFVQRTLPSIPGVRVKESFLLSRVLREADRWVPRQIEDQDGA
jgi:Lrp/AsnC family transcriptional regulator, regulator for asnA, asnC and gidA